MATENVLERMESELAEAEKAFEIAVRCGRELNGTPELKEAYEEAQRDSRALNAFREFCLQKAREELKEKGAVKPCDGCKFDVARKLLSKVIDDRFTEEMREFLLLVLENPELPIVPMVYTECVGGDDQFAYWLSKVGRSEIREFAIDEWYHDGAVVYRRRRNDRGGLSRILPRARVELERGNNKNGKWVYRPLQYT